jgi:hypothetical protein
MAQSLRRGGAGPDSFVLASSLFLRLLALVYLIAFVSLWTQVDGLIGRNGILPAGRFFDAAREQLGASRYWRLPSLCWLAPGDAFLHVLCAAGVVLALLLAAGAAPVPVLFLLWAAYLSLSIAGQTFLSFQWDILLLEAGFLAMFFPAAPWSIRPRLLDAPAREGLLLERLLLFKLMFLSGITKLLSGDAAWRNLTALEYHYETQPLPSVVGWYAHQLPGWFQKVSCAGMYAIEIGLPFLIFAPRPLRRAAAAGFVLLQVLIAATGSYCFFNLLTLALCVLLLDDLLLARAAWRGLAERAAALGPAPRGPLRRRVVAPIAILVAAVSALAIADEMVRTARPGPGNAILAAVLAPGETLRTINGYGLFRVMTTTRPEIVIEGSSDGVTWKPYEFRWKPGDTRRRPRYAAPHQPRLDWQMWFAALGPQRSAHWLEPLARRLLEGSPEVLALLREDPFPEAPPKQLRMVMYRYRFSDPAARRAIGEWWQRERVGMLLPPVSLESLSRAPTR